MTRPLMEPSIPLGQGKQGYGINRLERHSNTDWRLAEVAWDWPALLDENTEATTLALSAATVGTGRTMTAPFRVAVAITSR